MRTFADPLIYLGHLSRLIYVLAIENMIDNELKRGVTISWTMIHGNYVRFTVIVYVTYFLLLWTLKCADIALSAV